MFFRAVQSNMMTLMVRLYWRLNINNLRQRQLVMQLNPVRFPRLWSGTMSGKLLGNMIDRWCNRRPLPMCAPLSMAWACKALCGRMTRRNRCRNAEHGVAQKSKQLLHPARRSVAQSPAVTPGSWQLAVQLARRLPGKPALVRWLSPQRWRRAVGS